MKLSSSGCRRGFSVWMHRAHRAGSRSTARGARAGSRAAWRPDRRARSPSPSRARGQPASARARTRPSWCDRSSRPAGARRTLRVPLSRSARSTSAVSASGKSSIIRPSRIVSVMVSSVMAVRSPAEHDRGARRTRNPVRRASCGQRELRLGRGRLVGRRRAGAAGPRAGQGQAHDLLDHRAELPVQRAGVVRAAP